MPTGRDAAHPPGRRTGTIGGVIIPTVKPASKTITRCMMYLSYCARLLGYCSTGLSPVVGDRGAGMDASCRLRQLLELCGDGRPWAVAGHASTSWTWSSRYRRGRLARTRPLCTQRAECAPAQAFARLEPIRRVRESRIHPWTRLGNGRGTELACPTWLTRQATQTSDGSRERSTSAHACCGPRTRRAGAFP